MKEAKVFYELRQRRAREARERAERAHALFAEIMQRAGIPTTERTEKDKEFSPRGTRGFTGKE